MIKYGRARYDGKKMYFDEFAWAMIKEAARRKHKSPTYIVTRALMLLLGKQHGEKNKKP